MNERERAHQSEQEATRAELIHVGKAEKSEMAESKRKDGRERRKEEDDSTLIGKGGKGCKEE
jgi:hypothetical protein